MLAGRDRFGLSTHTWRHGVTARLADGRRAACLGVIGRAALARRTHAEIDGVVETWMGMLSNASSRVAAVAGSEDLIDYPEAHGPVQEVEHHQPETFDQDELSLCVEAAANGRSFRTGDTRRRA